MIWFFMIATTIADVYFMHNGMFFNGTLSKIFLTILVLGYLKHYDEKIKSYEKLNHWLDVTAKYSFGLFFVHWYFVWWFVVFWFFFHRHHGRYYQRGIDYGCI